MFVAAAFLFRFYNPELRILYSGAMYGTAMDAAIAIAVALGPCWLPLAHIPQFTRGARATNSIGRC